MCARLLLVMSAGLLLSAPALGQDAKADQAKLQGEWEAVSIERDGNKTPEAVAKTFRRKIEGNKYTVTFKMGDKVQTVKGTFKLDPSKKPKALDIQLDLGDGQEGTAKGIYEIDGEKLKTAFPSDGPKGKRPSDFKGENVMIVIWKQQKT